MGTYHRSMVGALTAGGLKMPAGPADNGVMDINIMRFGALIMSAAILTGAAGQAQAMPHPYGRGDASTALHVKQAKHPRSATPMVVRWATRAERDLHPYGRGSYSGPARSLRMIPTRGSDGSNALCRPGSKAARFSC